MASATEIAAGVTVELVIAAIAIGVLYRLYSLLFTVPKRHVVLSFQRGVVLRSGQMERVLGPGRYWITPKCTLLLCDVRPKPFQVPTQGLLTADGIGVRVSLGGEYRVVEPVAFLTESSDGFGALFLEVRHALHLAVGELTGEAILSGRDTLMSRVKELLIPRAAQLGIEMTQLNVWEAVPIGWQRQI